MSRWNRPVDQNWTEKPYIIWCSGCDYMAKIYVKQPPRICPACKKQLKKMVLLR